MNKLLFKRIDFWLQIGVFLAICIFSVFYSEIVFFGYFIIGFIQILSTILNIFNFKVARNKQRKLYEKVILILLVLTIISFYWLDILVFGFFVMIYSPILAIWYLVITWFELKEMEKEVETLTKK